MQIILSNSHCKENIALTPLVLVSFCVGVAVYGVYGVANGAVTAVTLPFTLQNAKQAVFAF